MILTVTEYEKIHIGKIRNISKKQISKADVEAIRIIDINNKGIFMWGNRHIIPQQWVGVISLPGLSIEILPKVADSYDYAELKEILLHMFNVGHGIPSKRNIKSRVDFSQNGLVEILIFNYIDKMDYYIREGLIKSYKKVVRNISTVKGSIVFSKHINRNILNPTRVYCKYSKLDIDNDVNKLFKYTLLEMKKISKDFYNIKRINSLLVHVEDVATISPRDYTKLNIQISAINHRISGLVEYSRLFLDGYSVSLSSGDNLIFSMLFDMNKIFEMFIYKSLQKILGSRVMYQDGRNFLLTDSLKIKKKIKLRPDILIKNRTGVNIVVDTKWKETKTFVKESDAYQMNAYVSSIPKVNTAILLYPKTIKSTKVVGDYKFNNKLNDKELKVRVVDLELIKERVKFREHLEKIIEI